MLNSTLFLEFTPGLWTRAGGKGAQEVGWVVRNLPQEITKE